MAGDQVEPGKPPPPETGLTLAELRAPLGAFESFVVGANALDVTRTPDPHSLRIGRLKPGRTLKLGKMEPPMDDGLIRACVRLDIEDLESKDSSTWRSLWPSQQQLVELACT